MRMLRRSLLLSFALLLSSCSLFAQTGYLQGTVMKHSGKADDTFIISDPNDIQTVQTMLSNPPPTAKQLPMSGSEPTYDPAKWNKEGVVLKNNCYAYATDNMTNTFPQPGKGSGAEPTPPYTCDNVTAAAVSDGLVKASCDNACPKGSFKVALVINPDPTGNDFHWYRQHSNGN